MFCVDSPPTMWGQHSTNLQGNWLFLIFFFFSFFLFPLVLSISFDSWIVYSCKMYKTCLGNDQWMTMWKGMKRNEEFQESKEMVCKIFVLFYLSSRIVGNYKVRKSRRVLPFGWDPENSMSSLYFHSASNFYLL